MRAQARAWVAGGLLALGAAGVALAAAPPMRRAPGGASDAVATVGPTRILRAEFEARTEQAMAEYHRRTGSEVPEPMKPLVRRQLLERLIQRNLLILEARRLGLAPTDAEADQVIRQDPFFQDGGRFNAAKYEALRTQNPAMYREALEQARERLAARRLSDRVEAKSHPDEQALRESATRSLERLSFDYFGLRRSDFSGEPEPREAEVVAFFRDHASEYHQPGKATLSVIAVSQSIGDSLAHAPGGITAWERSLRDRADSVLRVVRGGAPIEDVARPFGGVQTVALPGRRTARIWRGDAHALDLVYAAKPGDVLPELVASNPGWLVVRVDAVEPAHPARLSEVAMEIRARLRAERHASAERNDFVALYAAHRDSLRGTAYRARYAAIDTTTFDPGEPSPADLDRYYRGHLADYSSFDPARGTIVATPLDQVREEIRQRWRHDRMIQLTRSLADRLYDLWSRGRRDAALERSAGVREAGPAPMGAPLDSGAAGATLTDSLQNRFGALGVGIGGYPRGTLVFDITQRVPNYVPTLEQAAPSLRAWRAAAQAHEDEAGARRLFERDPMQFKHGNVIHWTRLRIESPSFLMVDMTRAEVERYLRQHLDRYAAPELVHVSHILVSPKDASPEADRAARARADSLLVRIRAGEDFATLARAYSDDEATRDEGGDLGEFGRGAMLEEFERAAFGMRAGDVSGVVHTSVGYHILKCHNYQAAYVQPLAMIYSNVSSDLAKDKSDSLAARRADSLFRRIRTVSQAREAARRLGVPLMSFTHAIGDRENGNADVQVFFRHLETVSPGQFYPATVKEKDESWSVVWVDSITPPVAPDWDQARTAAIQRYRSEAGQRALQAKRAELDSMLAAGWSVDSLAGLWGGVHHVEKLPPGSSLPGFGTLNLDSLVARSGPSGLRPGVMSEWLEFPFGLARIRLAEREAPNSEQLAARMETERRSETERNLRTYYVTLKQRYPVKILDAALRGVTLPEATAGAGSP